jgi:LmbE family N-acetylglucosaminyl deacetylase
LGLEPWTVREVWFSGGPDPDHAVDVTATFDRKLAALRAHASQTRHMSDLEGILRERLSALASNCGLAPGRLAEAFTIIRTA